MKIIIITQDEPFYLAENIEYLIRHFPSHSKIVGCCLFDVSPFGKNESFIQKALKTFKVFGAGFFVHYTIEYIRSKLSSKKKVVKVLERAGVPIIRLDKGINHPESVAILKAFDPDLLVSIAGNQIFKRPIIDLAPKGCLNLHTALLPKYRGLMPTFWVLKNDEKETGVSVFFVDEGIDSGPIIVQERVVIGERTQQELIKYTKKVGMDAIIKAIDLIEGGSFNLIKNDESEKSYFSFPTRDDVKEFLRIGKRFY